LTCYHIGYIPILRLATSIGGVLTGRGADLIVIDDPLKAEEAWSEARRKAVNEWFDSTLVARPPVATAGWLEYAREQIKAQGM